VPVQPEDISSAASSVWVRVSDIVSENLSILLGSTAGSVMRQIQSAGCIIIMKTIAGSALRPWFGVVAAENEF